MSNVELLPIFPLHTVLFPGMVLPLRIFEPRYLRLVDDCTKERTTFGVSLIAQGQEVGEPAVPVTVGTSARIALIERQNNGTLNLWVIGEERFEIVQLLRDHSAPYAMAEVRWLRDPLEVAGRPTGHLVADVSKLSADYVEQLKRFVPDASVPKMGADWTPTELSFWVAALLQMDNSRRQDLLEAATTEDRLLLERSLLRLEIGILERVMRQPGPGRSDESYRPSVN